jgi:hypothetical protein
MKPGTIALALPATALSAPAGPDPDGGRLHRGSRGRAVFARQPAEIGRDEGVLTGVLDQTPFDITDSSETHMTTSRRDFLASSAAAAILTVLGRPSLAHGSLSLTGPCFTHASSRRSVEMLASSRFAGARSGIS